MPLDVERLNPEDFRRGDLLTEFKFSFAMPLKAQIVRAEGARSSVGYLTYESEEEACKVVHHLGGGDRMKVVDRVPKQ